jgi:glycosyltransferase involved in cell wall biosynthesis
MTSSPIVSICCITYNHEKYISQAIDSFLMQETDFDVEIVIGDDCSSDSTPLIIEEYRQKFPEKFRILKREKNLGSEVNFIKTIEACRGTYVALCEGDDYWTDPHKLALQVHTLEERTSHSFCVTSYSELTENDNTTNEVKLFNTNRNIEKETIFQPYLFKTLTALFRKSCLRSKIYKEVKCGDVFLVAELLFNGNGIYLPNNTATYRIHSNGMFSMKNDMKRFFIEYLRSRAINKYFHETYPEIKQLHAWNYKKFYSELKKSKTLSKFRIKWMILLYVHKKNL